MRRLLPLLVLLFSCFPSFAVEPFVISDIRVEGLQIVSAGTVFNYLPLKRGDQVDEEAARDAIRALFNTGFFKDVQLKQEGTVLVVIVKERPSIAEITLTGNSQYDDDTLLEAMEPSGLVEGRIFVTAALENVIQEIKSLYFSEGRYGATVESDVTNLERNRVAITIKIREGEIAKIKQIRIVGNEVYSEKELLKRFGLSPRKRFRFFSKKDRYSRQKLSGDLEILRSFYQDQGYLGFDIESTQVSITPDRKDIYITINITEGEQYTVSGYEVGGDLILPEEQLLAAITFEADSIYSRKEVEASRTAIEDMLANDGYAFANVNAIPDIDAENRTVSFTFFLDPGRRVYVRRINISGNTTTRDEVIRRELRQLEGGWFSAEKVQRSRVRLQRLGFFEDITIETPVVPGSPDQVDMEVTVKERATGSLLFGVGFSDEDGILLNASVVQENLFGTGREIELSVDTSDIVDSVNFRYLNPYHTIHGVARGFNVFAREVDAGAADTADYILEDLGGGVTYRFPLSEFNSWNLGLGVERIDLTATPETPPSFRLFIDQNPSNDLWKITGSVAHDTRDSTIYPTRGAEQRLTYEIAGPGSDLEFFKLTARASWYRPLTDRFVFKAAGEVGYGDGYGDTRKLPFFKNYFAGGSSTVRGYQARSLGPRDLGPTPEPIGGNTRLLVNTELLMPIFGSEETKDKRLAFFIDGGQVYDSDFDVSLSDMRFSAGIALYWLSAIGPLSISAAQPLNDKAIDEIERIQISLGRVFR